MTSSSFALKQHRWVASTYATTGRQGDPGSRQRTSHASWEGDEKLELGRVKQRKALFFFCFLFFLFKASAHGTNMATVHGTKFQIHLKNGTWRTAGKVAKPLGLVRANRSEHSSSHCRRRKVHPHEGAEETEIPTTPAGTRLEAHWGFHATAP